MGEIVSAPGAPGTMPTNGRWGWYKDHLGDEYQRTSNLVKKVETDTFHLEQWMKRQVAEGLAVRDDLMLALKAMGRPGPNGWSYSDKTKINGICKDAAEAAKQRDGARVGTAVHDLTERLDRGEPLASVTAGLPPEAAADVRAYDALVDLNGWKVVEVERTIVNDDVNAGGSFDRIYDVPGLAKLLGPGECQHDHADRQLIHNTGSGELPVIGDVKTENDPTKNGLHIGPQLAIYSRARRMWLPTPEYVPAICVRQDVGIVVHVRNGQAIPIFIDLAKGWDAALAARAQANRERDAKQEFGAPGAWFAPMPGIVEQAPAADNRGAGLKSLVEQAVAADYGNPNRPPAGGYKVGDTVTVGGATFTKHSEGDPAAGLCPNCAPLVLHVSATRTDGTGGDQRCATCFNLTPEGTPQLATALSDASRHVSASGEQVAVTRPDGMVEWRPAGELDDVDRGAIRVIWQASSVEQLSAVWETYTGPRVGRVWAGRVAEAAAARQKQVTCVQRALHVGGSGTRCACGWTSEVAP